MRQSEKDNKEVIRRIFQEIWVDGRLEMVEELVAEDYYEHDTLDPEAGHGREGFVKNVRGFRAAFPDPEFEIHHLLADGDMVTITFSMRGEHAGDLMGIAPTGKKIDVTGIEVNRIEAGKLAETWANVDFLEMFRQLGVVSLPETE